MKSQKHYFDFAVFALIVAAFLFVAAQRLGAVPVPEGDEAFTLQVPYSMHHHGNIALPMLRYLGGNIENVWHSYTPVYFLILNGFFKVSGFGMVQGRVFNLLTAALTLLMVYLIGRRLFDWRAGLIAVVMLVGDQVIFERSRFLRNDFAAASFALLAFYLYEIAEQRKSAKHFVASGLAAGAGVMCHTNIIYMLGAICLLMLLREGWRALISRKLYLFTGSAFIVMAYEIIYDIIDYKNYLLQNRDDDVHFRLLEPSGWWANILDERLRYLKWYTGSLMFPDLPQTTLRIFQLLTIAAIVYLLIVLVRQIKRGNLMSETKIDVLVVTVVVVVFHAIITSQKRVFYLIHIVPWLALCVGIMLRDGLEQLGRLREASWPRAKLAYQVAMITVALAALGHGLLLVRQYKSYLTQVRNPELASFEEFTAVIKDIIPEGLCPVAVKNPSVWLAFPEKDRCFANIESRMREEVYADIDGKDYALVTRQNALPERPKNSLQTSKEPDDNYHLLGEMRNTPYGNLLIYYTGADPRYLSLATRRFQFFDQLRGHVLIE